MRTHTLRHAARICRAIETSSSDGTPNLVEVRFRLTGEPTIEITGAANIPDLKTRIEAEGLLPELAVI